MMRADAEVLREIEREFGRVTAKHVVEAARANDHPWHDRIDWNDETAAESHRLAQARALIRSVVLRTRTENRILYSPAYVRDPDAAPHEQAYASVVSLRSDEDRARAVVIMEFGRVASALRRARELADVLGLGGEVEDMLAQVEGLSAVLRHGQSEGSRAAQ